MRKYLKVLKISLKNNTTYFKDFLMSYSLIILVIVVYILLWNNLYSQNVKTGFTFKEIIWYLIINQLVFSNNMDLFKQIENDIKSGNIAYLLNKPYSYPIYMVFNSLGRILLRFGIILVLGLLIGVIFIGTLSSFTLINLVPIIIMMLLGIILNITIYILISMTSFWLEENKPFIWIYRQFVFSFGGFMIPLTMFPEKLYKLMQFMPWTYVAFHPSNSIVHFSYQNFFETVIGQLAYIALFSLLISIVFKKGADALNVNGG